VTDRVAVESGEQCQVIESSQDAPSFESGRVWYPRAGWAGTMIIRGPERVSTTHIVSARSDPWMGLSEPVDDEARCAESDWWIAARGL
jgi:hypothetical protein